MAGIPTCHHRHVVQLVLLSFSWILSSGLANADDSHVIFTDKTTELGLQLSNSAACWADFDNDGWVDLCAAAVWKNEEGKRFTKVNTDAIGAQVRIKLGDKTLTRQVEAGTGEGNQNDLTLHFGLDKRQDPVRLDIAWPNKSRQTVTDVKVNQLVTVRFGASP